MLNKEQLSRFEVIASNDIILGHDEVFIPKAASVNPSVIDKYTITYNADLKKCSIVKITAGKCIIFEISKETYLEIMKIFQPNVLQGNYKEIQFSKEVADIFETRALVLYKLTH